MFKVCEHCGKKIERATGWTPSRWAATRFCSRSCSGLHHRAPQQAAECQSCGGAFHPLSQSKKLFCSMQCSADFRTRPPLDRFMDKVIPEPNSGCWIWLGATNHAGYGTFYDGRKFVRAHKFSYETFVGAVPDGFILRHRCDLPPCVNPDHLLTGTQLDNIHDAIERGRLKWEHLHP